MDELNEAIGKTLADAKFRFPPLARLAERFRKYEAGEWEDSDFTEVTQEELDKLDAGDLRAIILLVEPLCPYYRTYKGVRIIGGNGWWQIEDGPRFKTMTEVVRHLDGP